MAQLLNGLKASVEVVEIIANFDQIPNSDKKCHKTIFRLDDGCEYPGQFCTVENNPPFETGDTIDITIKSFTRGIYTFTVDKITGFREIDLVNKPKGSQTQIITSFLNVASTPGAIALQASVLHNTHRINISTEKILEDAKIFADFLRSNTN